MTKKIKIIILSTILITTILVLGIIGIEYNNFSKIPEKVKVNYLYKLNAYTEQRVKNSDVIICEFNLTDPEYILIFEEMFEGNSYYDYTYWNLTRPSLFSQDWTIDKYTGYNGGGSTGVVNNFDELKNMVKKDCNQFKNAPNFNKPKTKETQLAEEQAEQAKIQKEKEFRENNHGYIKDELNLWFAKLDLSKQKEIIDYLDSIKLNPRISDNFKQLVEIFIKNYGMPQKPGYPID